MMREIYRARADIDEGPVSVWEAAGRSGRTRSMRARLEWKVWQMRAPCIPEAA